MRIKVLGHLCMSLALAALVGLQSACAGGGDAGNGGTPGGNTTPAFSLSLNPASLTVQRGGAQGIMQVTVLPQNGFSSALTFTQNGLPSGVAASYEPGTAAMTYLLKFSADTSVAAASYPFTLTGHATGAADASVTGTLVVNAASQPSFSLSSAPASLSLAKGSAGTSTITITPAGGFSGAVTLTASGLPSGVTADFSPATATASSTLTLTVGAGAATGTSTITIGGHATGAADTSTSVQLTVTPPSGGGQITMRPCLQENDVIFFAVQDGSGPWTPVTGSGGAYSFSLASGRGTVAITLRDQVHTDQIYTMVLIGSSSELAAQMQDPCPGYQPVSGTFSGAVPGHTVSIALGIAGITNVPAPAGGGGAWTTSTVMKRSLGDLFAADSAPGGGTTKCILRRDIPLSGPSPSVGGDLNFAGSEAFVPDSATITLSGLSSTTTVVTAVCHLWTPGLDVGVVGSSFAFGGGNPGPIAVVPASKLRAGDLQSVMATAMPMDYATRGGTSPMLLSQYWMATPGPVSLNFPAPAPPPTVVFTQHSPHPRLRFTSNWPSPYTSAFLFNAVQTQGSSSRGWQVLMSPGWVTAGGSMLVETPDFTGLAGWNETWDLWLGGDVLWTTTNSGVVGGNRVDGGRQWTCNYSNTIKP